VAEMKINEDGVRDHRETPCFAKAAMSIAWPSFLAAAALTGLFFSSVDPNELVVFGVELELERREAYGLGFMVFWGFSALASAMTYMLARPPESNPANYVPQRASNSKGRH
jgi:hypothetical protein